MKYDLRDTMTLDDFKNHFDDPSKITEVKRINRNTFKYCIDGKVKVRLCETDIMIYEKKSIILNTSGFRTFLTKNRLNERLSGYIYQDKSNWYYKDIYGTITRFFDGIKIDKISNQVMNGKSAPDFKKIDKKIDKKNEKTLKHIKAYCEKINKLKTLPDDSSGDCFYCQHEQMGKQDTDHLIMHLKEKYIMKSLLLNALKEKGYNCPSFIYNISKDNKADRKQIIRSVKDYFKNHLIK